MNIEYDWIEYDIFWKHTNTHTNFWQSETPVAPSSTTDALCEGVSWLSLPTLFPSMPSAFLHWDSKWIQIWLLQTIWGFKDPTKALSLSSFSSRLNVYTIYLFQVWSQPVLWMSLSLSPGPFLSLLLKSETQNSTECSRYHEFIAASFLFVPPPFLGIDVLRFSHNAEHFTELCISRFCSWVILVSLEEVNVYIYNSSQLVIFFASLNNWVLLPKTSLFTPFLGDLLQ